MSDLLSDPEEVNDYFASICTTDTYNINEVEKYRSILEIDDVRPHVNDYEVEIYYALLNELLLAVIIYQHGCLDIVLLNWLLLLLIFLICPSQLVNFQDNGCVP